MPQAHHVPPPARCRRRLSEPRDDLRRGLHPDLGVEPWCLRQRSCPDRWPGRTRHDAVFQPYHTHYNRLRRHCAGRSVGPQHGQPRVHHRAVLPRHYSRPPGDARTRTPAARLKAHSPDLRLKALPPMPVCYMTAPLYLQRVCSRIASSGCKARMRPDRGLALAAVASGRPRASAGAAGSR
jgi:hypothetical protein